MKTSGSLFFKKILDQIVERKNTNLQIIQYLNGDYAEILQVNRYYKGKIAC